MAPDASAPASHDWRWQLRHALRSPAAIRRAIGLAAPDVDATEQTAAAEQTAATKQADAWLDDGAFEVGVTPYFASLCRPDPADPLTRQILPDAAEAEVAPWELADPLGEDPHRVAPGLVRKYPDRVLLLVTDTCASYCRYCTRARWVAKHDEPLGTAQLDAAIAWIADHPEIRDVLISGGDPLLLADRRLGALLDRLDTIDHLRFVRIGTRVPVFLPMRVDEGLLAALGRPRRLPLFINVHINHHRELSPQARDALDALRRAGVGLGGQTVLLRGVNDDVETLRETFYAMLGAGVRPYYLFHCDPVRGTSHLRTSLDAGLALIEGLVGHVSGMAVPKYALDLPGGGKVPLWPDAVQSKAHAFWDVRGYAGERFRYPNAAVSRASSAQQPSDAAR